MSRLKSLKYLYIYRTGRVVDTNIIRRILLKRFGRYANIDLEIGILAIQEALHVS